jgi:peroxiredoxin
VNGKEGHLTMNEAKKNFLAEKSASTDLLLDSDGRVGKSFGAKTTPHMFIINPEGKVVYAGAIDDKPSTEKEDLKSAKNYVKAALEEGLSGKPVTVSTTRPYGCSVKY